MYIKYLALPLLPLAVYKRQTWDTLKPGPRSPSSPKPSGLAQPARGRAGNAGSHKGSLNLDARNQGGKKEEKKAPLRTRARRVLVWPFTRYLQSSPNKIKDTHARAHTHKYNHPPDPTQTQSSTKTLSLAPRLHFSGSVGADLLTAHAATCAQSEQLFQ